MSHFTTIKTQIYDRAILVKVLMEVGFEDVEVHDQPQPLYGYSGDVRPETAEIIIRRQFIGEFSNDIGFRQQADGSYTAIISDYDRVTYDQEWLGKLTQKYAYYKLLTIAHSQGLARQTEEILEDGTIRLVLA
jgi:hypothetical protein